MNAVLNALSQGSTWRGLIMLATAAGLQLAPELQTALVSVGLALSGLIGVLINETGMS